MNRGRKKRSRSQDNSRIRLLKQITLNELVVQIDKHLLIIDSFGLRDFSHPTQLNPFLTKVLIFPMGLSELLALEFFPLLT